MGSACTRHDKSCLCLIPDASPETSQPALRSPTDWNSTGQAADGDFSVLHPFSEMPPSASRAQAKATEPADWVEGGRCARPTPAHIPHGAAGAGRAGVSAPPRGGARQGSRRPAAPRGYSGSGVQGAGRDVPPQGGLQDPGAASAGVPRPRAAPEGR